MLSFYSADNGDFKKGIANQIGFQVSSGSRLVMVVKKNGSILRNLISWLRLQNAAGQAKITAPALIIDDEADHASVNTSRDPDDDPTTINKSIRKLLMSFERIGFVGYTATPFANIFINMDADHQEYGPDLFPRSFIVNLKAPSDYVGPNRVFGHSGDESAGIAEQPPLPMFEKINDASSWLPDKHNKYTIQEGDSYFVQYPPGATQWKFLELHLKKGTSKDVRFCLRIYFFWDEEIQLVVVGWLPNHLDTKAT